MITFMESFFNELVHESIATRKMLALVPADKLDWAPHTKSMKLKDLAIHIADLPTWITMGINTSELDFAVSPYNPKDCKNADELVACFDNNVEEAKTNLKNSSDSILEDKWTLRNGDAVYMELTKLDTI